MIVNISGCRVWCGGGEERKGGRLADHSTDLSDSGIICCCWYFQDVGVCWDRFLFIYLYLSDYLAYQSSVPGWTGVEGSVPLLHDPEGDPWQVSWISVYDFWLERSGGRLE